VGINVFGQVGTHWTSTGGACEWETILDTTGTRSPIVPGLTEVFWDNFLAYTQSLYGTASWPIYTAFGAYDSLYGIKEALESGDTLDIDALIPTFEATDRIGLLGRFQWTRNHDVYVTNSELGPYATGRTRAVMIQWQGGRKEVVWPINAAYSRMVRLPRQMYPLITDLTGGASPFVPDGRVDIKDLAATAKSYGSYFGHPNWNYVCDMNNDGKIDIKDLAIIAKDFGKSLPLPLP